MEKILKKMGILLLVIIVAFGVFGCGSTGGMNDDGDGGGDDGGSTPPDQPVEEEVVGEVRLFAEASSIFGDGRATTTITIVVENEDGLVISRNVVVTLSTTLGSLSANSVTTESGRATVILTSAASTQQAEIIAVSEGVVSEPIIVDFTPVPQEFSVGSSQNSVKTDNSDSALLTVTILDTNYVPIEGLNVGFRIDSGSGQLSASSVQTDEEGKAQATFKAGEISKANQTVWIAVTVPGLEEKLIPIQVVGTEISLSNDRSNLDKDRGTTATLTISLKDAGESAIFGATVTATVEPGNPSDPNTTQGDLSLTKMDGSGEMDQDGTIIGTTNINGQLKLQVLGTRAGDAVVRVSSLGDVKTQLYTVTSTEEAFAIIEPDTELASLKIGEELSIRVQNPKGTPVRFSTTFGEWVPEEGVEIKANGKVAEAEVGQDKTVTARLTATEAGFANVQVFDTGDATNATSDSIEVAISASVEDAAKIALQANPTVVAPTIGDVSYTSTLTATVRNVNDQVVSDVPVAFYIEKTTGGGERISPVVVFTNQLGEAETTFFSGSISTDAEGLTVKAVIVGNETVPAGTEKIIIGGSAGSVMIGQSTRMETSENNTHYILPMSVLVSDSNGNPVQTRVSIGLWPTRYRTGFWTRSQPCAPVITGDFLNEDLNRNLIRDLVPVDEDTDKDGQLTPPNSAAGSAGQCAQVDGEATGQNFILETGPDGVADFCLVYLKTSAVWIEDEVTATTLVSGTETRSTYTFWLPYLDDENCELPDSPYNREVGEISLQAEPTILLANGEATSTISAVVSNVSGDPVADGFRVNFQITGEGGFPVSKTASALTTSGVAMVTYTAPTSVGSGVARITATADNLTSNQVTITLNNGQLMLSSNKAKVTADGEDTTEITATVMDGNGNPIPSEGVRFSVTSAQENPGGFPSASSIWDTTGADGTAVVTFTAGTITGDTATVTISAVSETSEASGAMTLNLEKANIALAPATATLPADGQSELEVSAFLTGANGEILVSRPVQFAVINGGGGGFVSDGTAFTGTDGRARETYTAGTTPGQVQITASSPIAKAPGQNITVNLTSSGVGAIVLSADPTEVPADGQSTATITAIVTDSAGEPVVPGTVVSFTTSSGGGTFPNGNEAYDVVTTGDNGRVVVGLRAPTAETVAEVTASVSILDAQGNSINLRQKISVEFTGGVSFLDPSFVYLADLGGTTENPTPGTISVSGTRGQTSSQMVFEVTDANGSRVADGVQFNFSLISGHNGGEKLLTNSATTRTYLVDGGERSRVSAILESGLKSGIVLVKATYAQNSAISATAQVTIVGGPPVGSSFGISSEYYNISGLSTVGLLDKITVTASDIHGNAVPDNTAITFKTYETGGFFSPQDTDFTLTQGGFARNTLVSASSPTPVNGFVFVTAEAAGGVSTHITSLAVAEETLQNDILYAGTSGGGVYKSTDSGSTWKNISRSTQINGQNWIHPYVNAVAVDPDDLNVVYAGTGIRGSGALYRSIDGGLNWNSSNPEEWDGLISLNAAITSVVLDGNNSDYVWIGTNGQGLLYDEDPDAPPLFQQGTGLGFGRSVWDIAKYENTSGAAAIMYAAAGDGVYQSTDGGQTWDKTAGSIAAVKALALYPKANPGTSPHLIYAGTEESGVWYSTDSGANWIYAGDMENSIEPEDPGRNIKDLLLDVGNNRIYAVTYYEGDLQPHAFGNVYVMSVDDNGIPSSEWEEAASGLPAWSPPTDTTLFAQYALAAATDSSGDTKSLFIGGAGINFCKATTGLDTGAPAWNVQNSGLTNTIMARMPILFSGVVSPDLVVVHDQNVVGNELSFFVTVTDINGNPPVSGSQIKALLDGSVRQTRTVPDIYEGITYDFSVTLDPANSDKVEVEFDPPDDCGVSPGCSGGQTIRKVVYTD